MWSSIHAKILLVKLLQNRYRSIASVRWLVQLVITCTGRGNSDDLGQRICDDILVILRHNRGWDHGSMMDQWHQKLHNNTYPDEVIIFNALIEFRKRDGDLLKAVHLGTDFHSIVGRF